MTETDFDQNYLKNEVLFGAFWETSQNYSFYPSTFIVTSSSPVIIEISGCEDTGFAIRTLI
jgi:hypothetical protein